MTCSKGFRKLIFAFLFWKKCANLKFVSDHTNHQYKMGPPLPPPPLPGCHSPDLPDYCNLQQLTRAATCSTPLPPPHPPVSPIPPSPGAGRPLLSPAPSTRSGTSDVLNRSQSSCIYENELLYANRNGSTHTLTHAHHITSRFYKTCIKGNIH